MDPNWCFPICLTKKKIVFTQYVNDCSKCTLHHRNKRLKPISNTCLFLQLKFEDDLRISKMYSGEGEDVSFKKVMYPKGNVEDWLLEVENVMKESLRQIMGEALIDYALPEVTQTQRQNHYTCTVVPEKIYIYTIISL